MLKAETGRWAKPNKILLDNRKCMFQFVLECSLYKDLRKTYVKCYCWQRPNMPKLIELFSSEKGCIIKNLSSFIDKTFKMREQSGVI